MPGDEQLDAPAGDAEPAVAVRHHVEALLLAGPVDAVLGLELLRGGRRRGVLGKRAEDRPGQLLQPGSRGGGHTEHRGRVGAVPLTPPGDQASGVFLGQQIDLGEGDDLRQLIESGPVARELAADGLVVRFRVALRRRHFDQVNEDATALDVGEELVPEPSPLGGTLDQSRDVGEHELVVVELDRAEVGLHRREGVLGNLGIRPGQPREQRGLARVGQADQPDVGQQLETQLDLPRLALESPLGEARRLPRRGREALVAMTA